MDETSQALQRIAGGTEIVLLENYSMLFGFLSVTARFFQSRIRHFQPGFDDFECCICNSDDGVSEFSAKGGCVLSREESLQRLRN